MTIPEMPANGMLPDDSFFERAVPEDPMGELIVVERRERREAFRTLHAELGRVELLGFDDESRQSYHRTYTADGRRSVFFEAVLHTGIGRLFHIIVNDVASEPDDSFRLRIREFTVPQYARLIARRETETSRSHHQHHWHFTPYTGPILQASEKSVRIQRGKRSYTSFPYAGSRVPYLQVMTRRQDVQELSGILQTLDGVSIEEGILLKE